MGVWRVAHLSSADVIMSTVVLVLHRLEGKHNCTQIEKLECVSPTRFLIGLFDFHHLIKKLESPW
jgi:hypothetical protein